MYRNHEIRFLSSAGAIVATLALSAIPSVFAQSAPAPKWSLVTVATIKPDMRSDFEVWQREITAAYKKAGVPSRAVLQTVMGDLFEYVSVDDMSIRTKTSEPSEYALLTSMHLVAGKESEFNAWIEERVSSRDEEG
jgi:hypothetical protein